MDKLSLELFKKIRRIQFQTTHLVEDILAGAYRSAFKGRGIEFEEVREYQPGDEIRTIDWNVTARMRHPYVKSFREEREMNVTLIVDTSASTLYGSGTQLKKELMTEIAALISFSAIKNNDKVALILFSDYVEKYFPPNKGTRHVLHIVREMLTYEPQHRGTNIGAALSFLGKVQKHSSICFLISDFICPDYSHEAALIAGKHDLIAIAFEAPSERDFPNMGLVTLSDLENEKMDLIDSSAFSIRQTLKENTSQRLLAQKKLMDKLGADFLLLETDRPYLPELRKFFLIRQMRQK